MPKSANWDVTSPVMDGEKAPAIDPGVYVAAIQKMEHFPDKQYVSLMFDIVEGDKAEFFTKNGAKDSAHCIILSYKDNAVGMTRGRLKAITESNPGYDADLAFQKDNWQSFFGKKFGVMMREEESIFRNDKGELIKIVRVVADQVFPVDKVSGKEVLGRKKLKAFDQATWDMEVESNPANCKDYTFSSPDQALPSKPTNNVSAASWGPSQQPAVPPSPSAYDADVPF